MPAPLAENGFPPDQRYYDDVQPGDELAAEREQVDAVQMFQFSAATYNAHRIHYDKDWAVGTEGYPDTVVQGPLQAALLARLVTNWIGGRGRLLEYRVQNRASAYRGAVLELRGSVDGKRIDQGRGLIELSLECRCEGQLLAPGTALVQLPIRG
jgi:acyl dehydratase